MPIPPLRRIRPGWWLDIACLAGFVTLTATLAAGGLLGIDIAVRDFVDAHRPPWLWHVLRGLNFLGSGRWLTLISLGIALWWLWRSRRIWPLVAVVSAFLLTGFAIKPLKVWTHRLPPHDAAIGSAELFVAPHLGWFSGGPENESYPSGHAVNIVVWYAVLVILLAPWLSTRWRRVIRIVPVAVVTVTTVYLGFHWLTDTIAGLLLGIVLARLIERVDWLGPRSALDAGPGHRPVAIERP